MMCHVKRASKACHGFALLGFASLLETNELDLSDEVVFHTLVKEAIAHYDVRQSELAAQFGVNLSTVTRWAAGTSAPHPMMRPHIIEWLRDEVENQLESLNFDRLDFQEVEERARKTRRKLATF